MANFTQKMLPSDRCILDPVRYASYVVTSPKGDRREMILSKAVMIPFVLILCTMYNFQLKHN